MALIKCSECKSEVSDKASSCPKCGAPITHSKIIEQRAAVSQSKWNEDISNAFMIQVLIVAAVAGFSKESWYVFGGTFMGLAVLLMIPILGKIVGIILSAIWGIIGAAIGNEIWGEQAAIVIGIIIFLAMISVNFDGAKYFNDLNKK